MPYITRFPYLTIFQPYQAGKFTSSASASVSSVGVRASDAVARKLDDSKDYVYSTWDDNKMRYYVFPHCSGSFMSDGLFSLT